MNYHSPISLPLLLVVVVMTMSSFANGNMNGKCDADLCVCLVDGGSSGGSAECPEWISRTSGDGRSYDTARATTCGPLTLCQGWISSFFIGSPQVSENCIFTSSGAEITSYLFIEADGVGNSTSSTVILNYTEPDDPIPVCSSETPFTLAPTMAPTVSPAPTTLPPTSAAQANLYFVSVIAVAAAAGIGTFFAL